jgi:hypothetical protein
MITLKYMSKKCSLMARAGFIRPVTRNSSNASYRWYCIFMLLNIVSPSTNGCQSVFLLTKFNRISLHQPFT